MTQEVEDKINKIIEESILPSVQMHGGHVELQSFKDGYRKYVKVLYT